MEKKDHSLDEFMRTFIVFIQEYILNRSSGEYITLKEAAKISGYSSDYIGQLIRGGKLHGKQVYSNVAWMTTEEALQLYLEEQEELKNEKKGLSRTSSTRRRARECLNRILIAPDALLRILLSVAVLLLGCIALLLFYISATTFDRYLEKRSAEKYVEQHVVDESLFAPTPFRIGNEVFDEGGESVLLPAIMY